MHKITKKMVTIKIDDILIEVTPGTTILTVARKHNIFIPSLCQLEGYKNSSVCRLCIIAIKTTNTIAHACSLIALNNMEIVTNSPKIKKIQTTLMGMILKEHGLCKRTPCEIEILAQKLNSLQTSKKSLSQNNISIIKELSSDYISLNSSLCIHCDRCISVCPHKVITKTKRGIDVVLAFDNNLPIEVSSCTSCGDCIAVCPAGAISHTSYKK